MDVDKLAKPKDKLAKSKDKITKPKDNASETVATLSLNVYTETFSRSQISTDELGGRQVGHTWIALKFKDRKSALRTLSQKRCAYICYTTQTFVSRCDRKRYRCNT